MRARTEVAIRKHVIAAYPKEACGLVIIARGHERYIPCRNIADDPTNDFVMHPEDQATAEDMGDILAVVHSHPDAAPVMSVSDRVQCANGDKPWYIIAVNADGTTSTLNRYEPDGYEAPLVGRPFIHGTLDCYALVRDWYKRERDIELPNYERHYNWWNKGQDLYMQLFRDAGFEPITDAIQVGDVILMQVRAPVVNHAAVYIGDGKMLHHMIALLSTREIYGGAYLTEQTRLVVRYKGDNHD